MSRSLLQTGYAQKDEEVMRFAGPRMILYHPVAAIRHLLQEFFHK